MNSLIELPLLTILTFLPLVGAALIALFIKMPKVNSIDSKRLEDWQDDCHKNSKAIAFWVSMVNFLVALIVFYYFDDTATTYQFTERFEIIKNSGIFYFMGIDGISLYLVLLTAFLIPVCILSSWKSITKRVKEYMILFLILESLVIGVFVSLDFLLFYFFFEASLIPMFLIIGIWGGDNRIYASYKFFLYTLLGSVFLLLAIIYLYVTFGTTDITILTQHSSVIKSDIQKILWLAFFFSFAVKVPMFPFHTWLPDAHVQAPTAGSVILAGILLKLGTYGFIRLSLPILPEASHFYANFIFVLSGIAVVYTSLIAFVQEDMKKMIAYSSIAHMGYVTAGIFAFNAVAMEGAIYQMLSHGIVSGALFLCVGVLYDRLHTKKIADFGGVVNYMPNFAKLFMLFTMASIGLPMTSGFVGEFLVLMGLFKSNILATIIVGTGIVLGACYMLSLYKRVIFGDESSEKISHLSDLNKIEYYILLTLGILVLFYGIYPKSLFVDIAPSVQMVLELANPKQ